MWMYMCIAAVFFLLCCKKRKKFPRTEKTKKYSKRSVFLMNVLKGRVGFLFWFFQIYGPRQLYCCGKDVYRPGTEICCNGLR